MPVRLFSGARSSGISFNQLHRTDHHRVKQQLICPFDNQVLEPATSSRKATSTAKTNTYR